MFSEYIYRKFNRNTYRTEANYLRQPTFFNIQYPTYLLECTLIRLEVNIAQGGPAPKETDA